MSGKRARINLHLLTTKTIMMRTINAFILLCVFCLFCQPTLAQRRVRLADLPPFERAVVVVKYFEGMHSWKNYPYYLKTNIIQRLP